MKKNMGSSDRFIRLFIGIILLSFSASSFFSGTLSLILGIVAAIMILTSLIGTCPLYSVLGIKTCSSKLKKT